MPRQLLVLVLFSLAVLAILAGVVGLATGTTAGVVLGVVLCGGVAAPLLLRVVRMADEDARRPPPPGGPPAGRFFDRERLGVVLVVGLGSTALGVYGLVGGRAVVFIPGSGEGAGWTVPGAGGVVAALGMILIGVGVLLHLRHFGRDDVRRPWGCGLPAGGLALFALGHLVWGAGVLARRAVG